MNNQNSNYTFTLAHLLEAQHIYKNKTKQLTLCKQRCLVRLAVYHTYIHVFLGGVIKFSIMGALGRS